MYLHHLPNIGAAFEPKAPPALAHISNESKLAVVRLLTVENEYRLQHFFHKISTDHTIPLQQATPSPVAVGDALRLQE